MAATASIEQKSVPQQIREEVARDAIRAGFKVLVVGRRRYFKDGRTTDIEVRDGVIDAVDSLSVPGTIEAVKLSAGVITAHSAALHMAWSEKRPVFLLYDEATGKQLLPGGPVGYMHGMNREDTDHMFFADYTKERFRGWIGKR
jgi:ADP-heptose:LPS heptosyltransferase